MCIQSSCTIVYNLALDTGGRSLHGDSLHIVGTDVLGGPFFYFKIPKAVGEGLAPPVVVGRISSARRIQQDPQAAKIVSQTKKRVKSKAQAYYVYVKLLFTLSLKYAEELQSNSPSRENCFADEERRQARAQAYLRTSRSCLSRALMYAEEFLGLDQCGRTYYPCVVT